jgi:hypothetical protein
MNDFIETTPLRAHVSKSNLHQLAGQLRMQVAAHALTDNEFKVWLIQFDALIAHLNGNRMLAARLYFNVLSKQLPPVLHKTAARYQWYELGCMVATCVSDYIAANDPVLMPLNAQVAAS